MLFLSRALRLLPILVLVAGSVFASHDRGERDTDDDYDLYDRNKENRDFRPRKNQQLEDYEYPSGDYRYRYNYSTNTYVNPENQYNQNNQDNQQYYYYPPQQQYNQQY